MPNRPKRNPVVIGETHLQRKRAPRNRTIILDDADVLPCSDRLRTLIMPATVASITNVTIWQDFLEAAPYLPDDFVDLLFVDPPYNLHKHFNSTSFHGMSDQAYETWIDSWLSQLRRTLKPTASIYVCCDWRSSSSVYRVLSKYFIIHNRITWEREKGRGSEHNWKNCSEDIWYTTVSKNYTYNPQAVKLKRKVIAPYRDLGGNPKDWSQDRSGSYRLTYPSNLWTDITIPFWSMAENTDHPTQKPEKLLAKIILASSNEGDFLFDPFLGSGPTSVAAKKLGRRYCGIEIDKSYACLAQKRLDMAETDKTIQGYAGGVFWERNTCNDQVENGSMASHAREESEESITMMPLWPEAI